MEDVESAEIFLEWLQEVVDDLPETFAVQMEHNFIMIQHQLWL